MKMQGGLAAAVISSPVIGSLAALQRDSKITPFLLYRKI